MTAEPLRRYLRIQVRADRQVLAALRRAAADTNRQIAAIIGDNPSAVVRRAQLRLAEAAIHREIDRVWREIADIAERAALVAARDAVGANAALDPYLRQLGLSGAERAVFGASAEATAVQAVQHALHRVTDTTGSTRRTLSETVYRSRLATREVADRVINSALARGLSAREFAAEVRGFVNPNTPGGVRYAANRLARTEINNAFHYAQRLDNDSKPWVIGQKWNLSGSHPHTDICDSLAVDDHDDLGSGVFKSGNVPNKPHPQCVIAGTNYRGLQPVAATSRRHTGQFVEIHTGNGRNLTVTPNHPILTTDGWVAATFLNPGSRIVCCGGIEAPNGFSTSNPNEQQVPTLVENVAGPCSESSLRWTDSIMSVVSEDFHGDGIGSDIAIVRSNSLPKLDIVYLSIFEPELQFPVDVGDVGFPEFSSPSSLYLGLPWHGTFSGRMSGLAPSEVLLRSSFGMYQDHSFGFSSHSNTLLAEPAFQGKRADIQVENFDDLSRGLFGIVEIDDLLSIRRFEATHDVYNFQTTSGWYLSNDIVTHNCLCFITPEMESEAEFLRRLRAGQYDDYLNARMPQFAA